MVHHPAVDKPQEEPHPDQRETLPFDPSPLVRTFFGDTTSVGKVQTLPEPTQAVAQTQEEEDPEMAEILRAPTRRLDSFADAEEPMPEASMPDPSTVAPSLDSNLIPKSPEDVPRDSVRRSLTSVFDQEVELTRLEQQSWKAEVETDETAIGGEPEKKVKKKPGRKKGQKNKGKKQGQKSKRERRIRERKKTPNAKKHRGLVRRLKRWKRLSKNHPNPKPENERRRYRLRFRLRYLKWFWRPPVPGKRLQPHPVDPNRTNRTIGKMGMVVRVEQLLPGDIAPFQRMVLACGML